MRRRRPPGKRPPSRRNSCHTRPLSRVLRKTGTTAHLHPLERRAGVLNGGRCCHREAVQSPSATHRSAAAIRPGTRAPATGVAVTATAWRRSGLRTVVRHGKCPVSPQAHHPTRCSHPPPGGAYPHLGCQSRSHCGRRGEPHHRPPAPGRAQGGRWSEAGALFPGRRRPGPAARRRVLGAAAGRRREAPPRGAGVSPETPAPRVVLPHPGVAAAGAGSRHTGCRVAHVGCVSGMGCA